MSAADEDDGLGPSAPRRDGPPPAFLLGVLVGAVLLGLVWATVAYVVHDPTATDASTSARLRLPAGSSASPTARPGPTRMERCVDAAITLSGPLAAAAPALDQWAVHVGAMNKLVVGALTLPQAKAFWNQTRAAAYQRIDDFHQAGQGLRRTGVDCPTPAMLGTTSSPELRACSRHVAAEAEELDAARRAITTWAHHVRAMDMLRMGRLSPTRATQMWLAMWQRGQDEIARYTRAARTTRDTPGCDGSVAPPPSGARAHGGSASGSSAPAQSPMPSMSSMN